MSFNNARSASYIKDNRISNDVKLGDLILLTGQNATDSVFLFNKTFQVKNFSFFEIANATILDTVHYNASIFKLPFDGVLGLSYAP